MFQQIDSAINAKMPLIWSPVLNKLMILITNIGGLLFLLLLSMIALGILAYKKRYGDSLLFLATMALGSLVEVALKEIIQRARPENALISVSGWSFPSGHATRAAIFFSLMIYLFKNDIKNKSMRMIFVTANIVLIFLIGFSRVYLNVHWFTDVIMGLIIGFVLTFIMIKIFPILEKRFR